MTGQNKKKAVRAALKARIADFVNRDPLERVITVAHYALVKLAEVEANTDAPVKYRFDKENYDRLKSNGFQLEF